MFHAINLAFPFHGNKDLIFKIYHIYLQNIISIFTKGLYIEKNTNILGCKIVRQQDKRGSNICENEIEINSGFGNSCNNII